MGLQDDAEWDDIGREAEHAARGTVAHLVGTSRDADWPAIGRTADEKVRAFLNDLFGRGKPAPSAPEQSEIKKDEPPIDPWA